MNSKKGAARDAKSVVTDKIRKVEEKDIKKRKGALKEAKAKKPRGSKKAAKAAKDPNAPKRPPTAFFLFLHEFRKSFKEEHPDVKGVTMVSSWICFYCCFSEFQSLGFSTISWQLVSSSVSSSLFIFLLTSSFNLSLLVSLLGIDVWLLCTL
jgi:hypothetical protein